MLYYIPDSEFNIENYPNLIGTMHKTAPSYVNVIELPDPYRKFECWKCGNNWFSKVELDKTSKYAIGVSGESDFCPKCGKKFSCSSAWLIEDGSDYPFPKTISPDNFKRIEQRRNRTNESDRAIDNLIACAKEVINDFDIFGETLQVDDDMKYGPNSPIEQLRSAIDRITNS